MADQHVSVHERLQWAHWKTDSGVIETWVNPHFQIIKDSAKDEFEVYWNALQKVVRLCPRLEEAQSFCQRLRDVLDGRDVVKEIVGLLEGDQVQEFPNVMFGGEPFPGHNQRAIDLITERWLGDGVTRGPGQDSRRRGIERV